MISCHELCALLRSNDKDRSKGRSKLQELVDASNTGTRGSHTLLQYSDKEWTSMLMALIDWEKKELKARLGVNTRLVCHMWYSTYSRLTLYYF